MLKIAPTARISHLADIEDSTRGTEIVIGEGTVIDSFVKIKPAGGTGSVVIGERCYLNPGVVIYSGNGIRLGNDVLIAANCTLAPVNHEFRDRSRTIYDQRFSPSKGGIEIGDDVWIGANTVVLDGARIGQGAVVAAGTVVRGELEPYGIYVGNPLRLIGHRE